MASPRQAGNPSRGGECVKMKTLKGSNINNPGWNEMEPGDKRGTNHSGHVYRLIKVLSLYGRKAAFIINDVMILICFLTSLYINSK